jgi:predicted ATPase
MITSIFVNGYKSLTDFRLDIQPGLSVLVGPNGSGKSNILSLFEFLSHASKYSLAEAVSRSGGAGALFTRRKDQEISNSFAVEITGYGRQSANKRQIRYGGRPSHSGEYHVEYKYSATVTLSDKGSKLLYTDQRLCFSVFSHPDARSRTNRATGEKRWHVDIVTQVDQLGNRSLRRNKINKPALKKVLGSSFYPIEPFHVTYLFDVATHSLFSVLRGYLAPSAKIYNDVASGYVYNLNPSAIKQPEDVARAAEISEDGSGLAATLFSIQENERAGPGRFGFVDIDEDKPKVSIDQLKEMFCLINDNITDVRVENNALENKLIVIASVKGASGKIDIPLTMLSDGTVKWFALVTAVLRENAIFSLEEPENYLHPYMQREVVEILRRSASGSSERFSLMTTHSESLLNALDPAEVVAVSMKEGQTVAIRSKFAEELREEIARSGFGLGHFYVSGAIE